jgi:hypothetical protein
MSIFSFASDILGVAEAGMGIAKMFGRQKTTPEQRAMQASIERASQLSDALANPNSPLFRQTSDAKLQQMRDDRIASVREYLGQATRQARRASPGATVYGRNPRRDEALTRALALSGENEGIKADTAARADLTSALGGQVQAGSLARAGIEPAWMQQQRKDTIIPGALSAGRDLAGALERISGGWGTGLMSPVQTNINDPNSMGTRSRSVNTRATGGLLGWV